MSKFNHILPADCHLVICDELSETVYSDWVRLFQDCFGGSSEKPKLIFRKYRLNRARFSLLYYKDNLVACYAGIFVDVGELSCFMSTDTMSNGQVRGGSILCAKPLYASLAENKVDLIFGYPNENIRALREQKLDWKFIKNLDLYVSLSCFDHASKNSTSVQIVKPRKGFFKKVPFFFALSGYDKSFGAIFTLTLACKRPQFFCLNLTYYFGIGRKTLYYKPLNPSLSSKQIALFMNSDFTNSSIDVP